MAPTRAHVVRVGRRRVGPSTCSRGTRWTSRVFRTSALRPSLRSLIATRRHGVGYYRNEHLADDDGLGDFGQALLGADVDEVAPSGRLIDLAAVFVHQVRGGLVAAERQYWGLLEFLVQTGVVGGSGP
jgi:hypothetical protein